MVAHFLQSFFTKGGAAQARPNPAPQTQSRDWDAGYDEYVQPRVPIRDPRPQGHGSDPEPRNWLVRSWMDSLPAEVRPVQLVADYEQIAFTIALHWGEQRDLKRYMEQLVFSSENARWCFAPGAFQELVRLESHLDQTGTQPEALEASPQGWQLADL